MHWCSVSGSAFANATRCGVIARMLDIVHAADSVILRESHAAFWGRPNTVPRAHAALAKGENRMILNNTAPHSLDGRARCVVNPHITLPSILGSAQYLQGSGLPRGLSTFAFHRRLSFTVSSHMVRGRMGRLLSNVFDHWTLGLLMRYTNALIVAITACVRLPLVL